MTYPIKCTNPSCGKTGKYRMNNTRGWWWMRCSCGFHTSSYKKEEWALEACEKGEHYLGSGNKIMEDRYKVGQ